VWFKQETTDDDIRRLGLVLYQMVSLCEDHEKDNISLEKIGKHFSQAIHTLLSSLSNSD
jgi:hypothetical protein